MTNDPMSTNDPAVTLAAVTTYLAEQAERAKHERDARQLALERAQERYEIFYGLLERIAMEASA